MLNQEVDKRVKKSAIQDQIKQAGEQLQDLIDRYGIDLVSKQFELEEWSKQLGEYLTEQDIEKRKGNTYANKHGEHKRTGGADLKTFSLTQKLVDFCYLDVIEGIRELILAVQTPKKGSKPSYYDTIKDILQIYSKQEDEAIHTIASIASTTLLECVIAGGSLQITNNIAKMIADNIQEEVRTTKLFNELPDKAVANISKGLDKRVGRHFKIYYVKYSMKLHQIEFNDWKAEDALTFGLVLIDIITSRSPYFCSIQPEAPTNHNKKMNLEVHASPALQEAWTKNIAGIIKRSSRFCPTVIPPKKWTSFSDGAYYGTLAGKASLLRLHDGLSFGQKTVFHSRYMKLLEQADITEVIASINAIQETPWQVNKQILAVLKYNNEHNKGWGKTPYFEPEPEPARLVGNFTEEELKAHKKKFVEHYKKENRRISKCLRLKDLEYTAEEFSKYPRIYFPHNMDFRGRVYPIYPTLSPQGDDIGKALIKFADTPPITDEASLKYFYIQGANVAGIDKVSIDDRILWIKEHRHDILASATDPTVNLWWTKQDKPWQFLAFCFEYLSLQQYKNKHNGTAIGWVTGLQFAQDGSCSGIQHYSAASRDYEGGKAVNLVPQDKPNDIYGYYADKVNQTLENDANNGTLDEEHTIEREDQTLTVLKLGTKNLAQRWLTFGINRKVTKRPVMTLPYGATAGGYKIQILEDTIESAKQEGRGQVFEGVEMQMAVYLAKVIANAVSGLNAVKYMQWLRDVTKLITKNGNVVTWCTPLGLPVQQTYMKSRAVTMRLRINGIRRYLYYNEVTGNIDDNGQKQGAPPNFIHSMDACHLQMTVLAAHRQGIRHFAMIHDSYGAPIAQADIMFQTVRDQFVKMYEKNDIFQQFLDNAKNYIKNETDLPELPKKGTLNLNDIKKSLYAFC